MQKRYISLLVALAACSPAAVKDAQKAVLNGLRDPASAQFKDVKVCASDGSIVVGEINAKNGLGGYAGFETFFFEAGRVVFASDRYFTQLSRRCYGRAPATEDSSNAQSIADALEESADNLEAAADAAEAEATR